LCHRFPIRSRRAKDLARRLATGTGFNRMRGTASAITAAMAIAKADGKRSCGSPGQLAVVGGWVPVPASHATRACDN
jgi:hypothetical protein